MRVLLVEDDAGLCDVVARGLDEAGMRTTAVPTGEAAVAELTHSTWDAVVLDLGLPGMDGLEVLRSARSGGVYAPVIVLTARDAVPDRIAALEEGADDYLIKPFSLRELLARLRALDRRARGTVDADMVLAGDLRLDPRTRRAWRGRRRLTLTPREFALLEAFMRRPGRLLTRSHLLEHAFEPGYEARSNVVDVYVSFLRQKLDRPFGSELIETVRGEGYRLRVEEDGEP